MVEGMIDYIKHPIVDDVADDMQLTEDDFLEFINSAIDKNKTELRVEYILKDGRLCIIQTYKNNEV